MAVVLLDDFTVGDLDGAPAAGSGVSFAAAIREDAGLRPVRELLEDLGERAVRLLLAAARTYALTIVTRDSDMLDYASEGHVRALGC